MCAGLVCSARHAPSAAAGSRPLAAELEGESITQLCQVNQLQSVNPWRPQHGLNTCKPSAATMEAATTSVDAMRADLKRAAEFGTLETVKELLEAGAPVDWTSGTGVSKAAPASTVPLGCASGPAR